MRLGNLISASFWQGWNRQERMEWWKRGKMEWEDKTWKEEFRALRGTRNLESPPLWDSKFVIVDSARGRRGRITFFDIALCHRLLFCVINRGSEVLSLLTFILAHFCRQTIGFTFLPAAAKAPLDWFGGVLHRHALLHLKMFPELPCVPLLVLLAFLYTEWSEALKQRRGERSNSPLSSPSSLCARRKMQQHR